MRSAVEGVGEEHFVLLYGYCAFGGAVLQGAYEDHCQEGGWAAGVDCLSGDAVAGAEVGEDDVGDGGREVGEEGDLLEVEGEEVALV